MKTKIFTFTLILLSIISFSSFAAELGNYEIVPIYPPGPYELALEDVKTVTPDEISHNLYQIHPEVKNIVVTTFVSERAWEQKYKNNVGKEINAKKYGIWVTIPHEFKNACKGFIEQYDITDEEDFLIYRATQLLGLPANSNKKKIIKILVDTEYLFRPSADREIHDNTAGEIDFENPGLLLEPSKQFLETQEAFDAFKVWFSGAYSDKYPWTKLGYTYDWGNANSDFGVSEFVIMGNSKIKILATYDLLEYCNN